MARLIPIVLRLQETREFDAAVDRREAKIRNLSTLTEKQFSQNSSSFGGGLDARRMQDFERAAKNLNRITSANAEAQINQARKVTDALISEERRAANEISKIRQSRVNTQSATGSGGGIGATVGSFLGNVGAQAVSSLTSLLTQGASALIDYNSKLEQTSIGFTSLLGSSEKAQTLLKQIQDFAKSTPFEFEGIAALSQRLAGANVESQKIIPLMRDIGNVVAATGETSQDRLEGVTVAITQMLGKGKVSAEEMEQLAERGVNGFQLLSEATGKSQADLRKLAGDGKLSTEVMIAALQKISQEKYGDAMQKQSQTFAGAMSNIKDSVMIAASTYFQPLYKAISDIAVRTAKEMEGADFSEATRILAKNLARGFGELLAVEIRSEMKNFKWQDAFLPQEIGAELKEGMFGNWNLYDYLTGNLKPEIKKFSADISKSVDLNGVKYQFDSVTNTLQRVKKTVRDTPSLAKQLDSQKAADDAKKLVQELNKIAVDYATKIFFFGDETEVAAAKQQLLAKGVSDFSTGAAKAIIGMAGMIDKLKENQKAAGDAEKAQEDYNNKLKSASEELTKMREDADFQIRFSNPTELEKFNQQIKSGAGNFRELAGEIEATRGALERLAISRAFAGAVKNSADFFSAISQSIDAVNAKSTTPFQSEILKLMQSVELFTAAGEKLDKGGVAEQIEKRIVDFQTELKKINDSAIGIVGDPDLIKEQLKTKTEKAINDWYTDFITFMRGVRQKVEIEGGTVSFPSFFEGAEGNMATAEKLIGLFEQFYNVAKKAKEVDYKSIDSSLQSQLDTLQRGGRELSEYDKTLKLLDTDYKNLSAAERDNLLSKAAMIDATNAAQESYEKLHDIVADSVDAFIDGGFKGLFDSIKDQFKRFLSDLFSQWLTSKIFKLFSKGEIGGAGNAASSGGNWLQKLLGGVFNRGSAGGIGGTPNFNPNNFAPSSGGSSNNLSAAFNNLIGGGSSGGYASTGIGAANAPNGMPGGKGKFGASQGMAIGGMLMSLIGSKIGGIGGSVLSYAGTGMSIGSLFGGPIGGAIGAGIGAVAGLIGGIIGRSKLRKAEEKQRTQFLLSAFGDIKQFDTLISDVKALRINPPSSALTTGEALSKSIIETYTQSASALKDKKTRNIALSEVPRLQSQIDEKMAALKLAVAGAQNAAEFSNKFVATFAGGVYMDSSFKNQYGDFKRQNGMMPGTWTGKDYIPALIANAEMVLNPYQQMNVIKNAGGVNPFEGAGIPNYKSPTKRQPTRMATGGFVGTASASNGSSFGAPIQNFNGNIILEGFTATPDAKAYLESPDGKRQVININREHVKNNPASSDGLSRDIKESLKK